MASASQSRPHRAQAHRALRRESPEQPEPERRARRRVYRPWAELLWTFGLDVLACPRCEGRMRLLALITEPRTVARFLHALGEPTDVPPPAPARGPPYWKSQVLRRSAGSEHAAE